MFEWNDVYVIIDVHEKKLLTRVCTLIGMVGDSPNITPPKMDNDILEAQFPCGFEKFIFLRIPIILHGERMPYWHTKIK